MPEHDPTSAAAAFLADPEKLRHLATLARNSVASARAAAFLSQEVEHLWLLRKDEAAEAARTVCCAIHECADLRREWHGLPCLEDVGELVPEEFLSELFRGVTLRLTDRREIVVVGRQKFPNAHHAAYEILNRTLHAWSFASAYQTFGLGVREDSAPVRQAIGLCHVTPEIVAVDPSRLETLIEFELADCVRESRRADGQGSGPPLSIPSSVLAGLILALRAEARAELSAPAPERAGPPLPPANQIEGPAAGNLLIGPKRTVPVEPTPWKLLNALWRRRSWPEEELAAEVWGAGGGGSEDAIKAAARRANDALLTAGFALNICRRGGRVYLE